MNNEKDGKTLSEITQMCIEEHIGDVDGARLCIIHEEFKRGFEFMKNYPKSVTIFGSARLAEDTEAAQKTTSLAKKIAEETGYAIVTGGGYGIMGAANKGAHLGNSPSLGINIQLPFEQHLNKYVSDSINFHHFFSRKVTLSYAAEAYIYCAGGFGTMDEMFEILTLKQTGKIPAVPIILFGSKFWKPLEEFFKQVLLEPGNETIDPKDLDLYIITDDEDEVLEIIKSAQVREKIAVDHHLK